MQDGKNPSEIWPDITYLNKLRHMRQIGEEKSNYAYFLYYSSQIKKRYPLTRTSGTRSPCQWNIFSFISNAKQRFHSTLFKQFGM